MNPALLGVVLEKLLRHLWPDKPAAGVTLGAGVRARLREPSTWAAAGQGAVLLTIFLGPEQGQAVAGVVGALIALYEAIRAERAKHPGPQ